MPRSRKACELLAWLAVHPGPHARSRLAARFWPDMLDSSARANLRSAVWSLRSALGGTAGEWLRTDREVVELRQHGLDVDLRSFDRLVADGQFEDADRLRRGEVLRRFDADWVFELRDEYDHRYADVLDALATRAADHADAAGFARRAERLRGQARESPAASVPPETAVVKRLVGRDGELERLLRCWRSARAGAGTVVEVSGDGGIGKTTLAEQVLAVAREDGALTAVGGVAGAAGAAPLGAWLEQLGQVIAAVALPTDEAWPAQLARVVPSAALPGQPTAGGGAVFDQVRCFEAVVELVVRGCRERPVALLVDDLHLADPSSLQLAAYLGRRVTRLPVLLVITRRRLPPRSDVDRTIGALRARGALGLELQLAPLGAAEVRELAATADLPREQVDHVVDVAAGSPLVATEVARALSGGADVSVGLQAAARWSVSRLHGPARLLVELAAVAGRDLTSAELAAFPQPADSVAAATEALGSGLLRMREGAIGFRHALLAESVYADLAEPVRARLHGAIAESLRRSGRRHTAEIARHLRLAGHRESAATYLLGAAAEARTVGALAEAATFLTEATELEPDAPDGFVELAEVQAWRGILGASDAAFDRALELIPPMDAGALASAWLRRGRWLRGGICHPRESRRSYACALDVLDRDPDADPPSRAEALAGMAWAEAVAGDEAAVDDLLLQVSAITRDQPVNDLLAHDVGVARGHALLRAGRFTESYGPLIAAGAAANRAGRPDMAYSCLINAASAAACVGDFDRSLDFIDRCLPLVIPNGLVRLGVYAYTARTTVLRRLGRLDEAGASSDRAADLAQRLELEELSGLVRYERALLAVSAGDWRTAATEFEAAIRMRAAVSVPLARLHRADALARAGQLTEAEAELRAMALQPVTPHDFPDTLVARMAAVQGQIAKHRGDLALASARLQEAAQGWQRRIDSAANGGTGYVAALVDLGRPPMTALIEPQRELAAVTADLAEIGRTDADVR